MNQIYLIYLNIFIKLVENEMRKKLLAYTRLRKDREEFRQRLVNMILHNDGKMEIDDLESNELTEDEKQILRYYYYIQHGIDNVHVSPINIAILKRVKPIK